jgi:hypothetical protein
MNIPNYNTINLVNPKTLFLTLNLRLRLDDSISIIASILREPLIHIVVGLGRAIQIIQVIHHPQRALLLVSQEREVEMELQQLRLYICQDNFMRHRGLLLGNHLHGVFLHDGLLRCGSSRWHRRRGWCSSDRGCSGVSSIVVILILILGIFSHAVKSSLLGDLHDELVVRLNHYLQGGLLFLQLLSIFSQPLAQGLQL